MQHLLVNTFTAAIIAASTSICIAQTWIGPTGQGENGSWSNDASWSGGAKPNAAGAVATFNNPTAVGNRTVTTDSGAGGYTLGILNFTNATGSSQTTDITRGTTGSKLIFDNGGAGAQINTSGGGTGKLTIGGSGSTTTLNEMLTAQVDQTTTSSSTGSLELTTTINGAGGLTKNGDGGMTLSTGSKTYTGATVINGGRTRISTAAAPTATSSFTINAGGQIEPITNNGTYTFGSGALNLNGAGPTSGPYSPFPGAIRPSTNLIITMGNTSVVLQSDTTVHMQGSATGDLRFPGNVSGVGKLLIGSAAHDNNIGKVTLIGTNSYQGGTKVQAGTLVATGASTTAFGTGAVTVDSGSAVFAGTVSKILIQTGATNAINDGATLSLTGGNVAGVADDGYADLETGIAEVIGGLSLGGIAQLGGKTYGSTASSAMVKNDEYFAGLGMVQVGILGDFNGDTKVNAADYVTWRKLDGSDVGYATWRENFSQTSSSSSGLQQASAVPEPATLALCGLSLALIATRRPNRHLRRD